MVYAASVRSLTYLVGFVGNLLVPKGVDAGNGGPWPLALGVDLALLLAFCLPHSLLAGERGIARIAPRLAPALHRSLYCLIAVVGLDLLVWQWRPLPTVLWQLDGAAAVGAWVLFGSGWLLAAGSTLSHGHFALFGLSQAWAWGRGRPFTPRTVQGTGLYRRFRHPMYLGFLLGIWATPRMTVGHALLAASLSIYTLLGARLEERRLLAQRSDLARWLAATPGLIPRPAPRPHDRLDS